MGKITECQLIIAATRQWFENSSESIESFATAHLIPALEDAGMAEVDRDSVESSAAAYTRWRRAVSMRVGRVIRGHVAFPLSWKWVWVGCLPESYRVELVRKLIAMAGSLFVEIPKLSGTADSLVRSKSRLHRISEEFGELLQNATPAHDGFYDLNDDPVLVDSMMKEAMDLVEVVLSEAAAVSRATGRPLPRTRMISVDITEVRRNEQ